MAFLYALPGAVAEGLIWGLMAIGVYISYKILDIADLTVDGSICTGACVCAVLLGQGVPYLKATYFTKHKDLHPSDLTAKNKGGAGNA